MKEWEKTVWNASRFHLIPRKVPMSSVHSHAEVLKTTAWFWSTENTTPSFQRHRRIVPYLPLASPIPPKLPLQTQLAAFRWSSLRERTNANTRFNLWIRRESMAHKEAMMATSRARASNKIIKNQVQINARILSYNICFRNSLFFHFVS